MSLTQSFSKSFAGKQKFGSKVSAIPSSPHRGRREGIESEMGRCEMMSFYKLLAGRLKNDSEHAAGRHEVASVDLPGPE